MTCSLCWSSTGTLSTHHSTGAFAWVLTMASSFNAKPVSYPFHMFLFIGGPFAGFGFFLSFCFMHGYLRIIIYNYSLLILIIISCVSLFLLSIYHKIMRGSCYGLMCILCWIHTRYLESSQFSICSVKKQMSDLPGFPTFLLMSWKNIWSLWAPMCLRNYSRVLTSYFEWVNTSTKVTRITCRHFKYAGHEACRDKQLPEIWENKRLSGICALISEVSCTSRQIFYI